MVDGWKEGRMDGRMVPRQIMVFLFRLCLLGIVLPSPWRENLTLRILFHLSRKMFIRGEALAKFLGKARFGHYEFNGHGPMLWEAFVFPKNRFKVLPKFIFTPLR